MISLRIRKVLGLKTSGFVEPVVGKQRAQWCTLVVLDFDVHLHLKYKIFSKQNFSLQYPGTTTCVVAKPLVYIISVQFGRLSLSICSYLVSMIFGSKTLVFFQFDCCLFQTTSIAWQCRGCFSISETRETLVAKLNNSRYYLHTYSASNCKLFPPK